MEESSKARENGAAYAALTARNAAAAVEHRRADRHATRLERPSSIER